MLNESVLIRKALEGDQDSFAKIVDFYKNYIFEIIKVESIVQYEENLRGNVKWNTTQIGNEDSPKYKGELVYGDGNNMVNILKCYEILVDGI